MRRPLLLSLCALAAALSVSSCATFDDTDEVAEVGDKELDEDTFAAMIESPVGEDVLQSSPLGGEVDGDTARRLLTTWVVLHALDDAGLLDEETKTATRDEISASYGDDWAATPVEMQELVVLNGAIGQLIGTDAVSQEQLVDVVRDAEIRIDPRYGRWDSTVLTVQPLG